MKILLVQCVWNEFDVLKFKVYYSKKNNIDLLTFDNMSDDGSDVMLNHLKTPFI